MKTKTINLYEFDELSDEVKNKVVERFREKNDYHFLEENLNECLSELLEKNNIKVINNDLNLRYSLGYSQGDGVSFIGTFKFKDLNFKINSSSSHYCHSKTTDIYLIDFDDDNDDDLSELVKENIKNEFEQIYYNICDEIEKNGYAYIEAEDDEKNIIENIKLNEYTFRKDGSLEDE